MNPLHRQLQNRKRPDREIGRNGRTDHLQASRNRIRDPTRRIPDAEFPLNEEELVDLVSYLEGLRK